MQSVLSVAFPLSAMIGSGYLIVKKNIISGETINGLILIVFWLFLPAFIFTNLLGADIGSIPDFSFIISYYMASGIVFLISTLSGHQCVHSGLKVSCLCQGSVERDVVYHRTKHLSDLWYFDSDELEIGQI